MHSIDLEIARRKTPVIAELLDGLAHVPASAPGLQSYHAAKAAVNGNLRTGAERRCAAVRAMLAAPGADPWALYRAETDKPRRVALLGFLRRGPGTLEDH